MRLPLLAALFLVAAWSPAAAEKMSFFMKNDVGRAVVVELYSEQRNQAWPGNDQVYLLDKGERKSVPVDCEAGERICYGAWLNGDAASFWGIGPDRDQRCTDCCFVCVGSSTADIVLSP